MGLNVTRYALVVSLAILAGCQGPKKLYQWESYQEQVYGYFNGGSAEEQAAALERDLQKIMGKDGNVPPGYHAQLGMLYMVLGRDDQMVQQFRTEKQLFPESSTYMDFLLTNAERGSTAP